MKGQLRLPAVLSVVVLTGGAVVAALGCGDDRSRPDAPTTDGPRADAGRVDARPVDGAPADAGCVNFCFPDGTGTGNECPFPTCATGVDHTTCPDHCTIGI